MSLGLLERWLVRDDRDRSIPPSIPEAINKLEAAIDDLRALAKLLPADPHPIRLTPDTNSLIDDPDLTIYRPDLGPRYLVHLLPVVLGEIDDLKRSGRTQDLRDAAKRANTRLKALRQNGDIRTGARVAGDVFAIFEHVEPRGDQLPSWLDLSVPDDRFAASILLLQSEHPGSVLYVATSDINLQTKLSALGLPFLDLP